MNALDDSSVHPLLGRCAAAAAAAYAAAFRERPRHELASSAGIGADGTATYLLDVLVEAPVLAVAEHAGVNVLSEEIGWVDRGSATTLVLDPLDGTANAVAGVPLCCFAAALAVDGVVEESLVVWLDGGRTWSARRGRPGPLRVTGRTALRGASVSMLRPRPANRAAFLAIADQVERVRVLGSSVLEACLVADGAIDAFCDPGGDVHRIVDVAATALIVEAAGGQMLDAFGRPFTLEPDLTLRWSGIAAATPELADALVAAIVPAGIPVA